MKFLRAFSSIRSVASSNGNLDYISHFIECNSHILHLKQIKLTDSTLVSDSVCFLLHGAIENGEIFYSKTGKGLAPYLARKGHNVFIGDIRGHGLSTPSIRDERFKCSHAQTETIRETIPTFCKSIQLLSGVEKQSWVAHSWGGVLLTSSLAYEPSLSNIVHSQVCIGTKRRILTRSMEYYLIFRGIFECGNWLTSKWKGYYPSKDFKIGSENQSNHYVDDIIDWVHCKWVDRKDGFDYDKAFNKAFVNENTKKFRIPPTWHMTGLKDTFLGHRADVQLWAEETHQVGTSMGQTPETSANITVLSKQNGYQLDYDHINIITSKVCESDHFPLISDYIYKHTRK